MNALMGCMLLDDGSHALELDWLSRVSVVIRSKSGVPRP